MKTNRITAIAAGLTALGLVGVAAGTGIASASGTQVVAKRQSAASAGSVSALDTTTPPAVCNGGSSLRLYTKLQPVPFSFAGTSNAMIPVPGAKMAFTGPSTGTDTLLVTFSAETYYSGTGWMNLQVTRNGLPIHPFANNGSPFAFASKPQYQGNSAQFCTKIAAGTWTLEVTTGTTGGATESGWLDDWTMSVQRFD